MRMRTIVILAQFKGTNNNTNGKRYYLLLNVKWPIFHHRQFYFIIGPNVLAHCLPFTRTVSFGMRGRGEKIACVQAAHKCACLNSDLCFTVTRAIHKSMLVHFSYGRTKLPVRTMIHYVHMVLSGYYRNIHMVEL